MALPTTLNTYGNMAGNLEFIIALFIKIVESLPENDEVQDDDLFGFVHDLDSITCLYLPLLDIICCGLPTNYIHFTSFIPPQQLFEGHFGVNKLLLIDSFTFHCDCDYYVFNIGTPRYTHCLSPCSKIDI